MNEYEELDSMITISKKPWYCRYYTGKHIKDVATRCMMSLDKPTHLFRKTEIQEFYNNYVVSKYPLSDNKEYCIRWDRTYTRLFVTKNPNQLWRI